MPVQILLGVIIRDYISMFELIVSLLFRLQAGTDELLGFGEFAE